MATCSPLHDRFWSKVKVGRGCWEWLGTVRLDGGGEIGLGREKDGIGLVHRVAVLLTGGELRDDQVLHHTCENRLCVNPDHLMWVTRSEHAKIHGFGDDQRYTSEDVRGERNPASKLTADDVRDIRRRYKGSSVTHQALADEYGVHRNAVSLIIRRERWAWLDEAEGHDA